MATISVSVVGTKELKRKLEKMNPGVNKKIVRNSLLESAEDLQRDAAKNQILAGGGGKKSGLTKPHKSYLTSRHGTLRRSIRVNRGPLPFAIEVGTDLGYGAMHETGGTFSVRAHTRPRKVKGVRIGGRMALSRGHTGPIRVKAHSMKVPKRPFLKRALDRIAPRFGDIVVKHWKKEAGL